MKRALFLIMFLTVLLGISSIWAVTPVYVDDDFTSSTPGWGVTHFATIANGINAVDSGGTVYVAAGNYASCGISKSVTLLGPNAEIHPVVGTHPTETVGTRVPEAIWDGCGPAADNITIDGFHFLKAGTRMIDTYSNANYFTLKNCIVQSTAYGATTGITQFGGGSHTDCIFEFNLFDDKGESTFYAGGGPYDRLIFRYNKFQSEGDAIFWTASTLVDGVFLANEFDGEAGANFNTINMGQAGNLQITDNWFHDCLYTPVQVGIINGSITGNTFEDMYPYGTGYGSYAFQLWGGAWGTPISTNVDISGNTIHYNGIAGSEPSYGISLNPPANVGDPSIDASTIHIHDNTFINDGVGTGTTYAIRHRGDQTTTVDAEYNWWGTDDGAVIATMNYGPTDYDPWYDSPTMDHLMSNAPVENVTQNTFYTTIQAAIDDADEGDVIEVDGGTYTEQLHITTNDLTIQGATRYPVVIKSPAVLALSFATPSINKPVVFVDGVASFTLKNVTVDGDFKGNANSRFQGIGFWNAGGTVENVEVINIIDNPFSGAQHGVGIYAYNNTPTVEYTITLLNIDISNFQKNGIALNGDATEKNLTVNVTYVDVIGQGPTGVTAQNGIQVQNASGVIDHCSVSGIDYTGSGWAASGILPYGAEDLQITYNTLIDCGYPIYPNVSNDVLIQNNNISAGVLNVGARTAITESGCTNLTVDTNVIHDAAYGMWLSPSTITNNTIVGADYALILDGGSGYTITGNTLTDNYVHVYNLGTEPDVNTLVGTNNYDNYYVVDQVVYGSASLLYVDVPDEVIPAGFTQTYSVVASYIEDLRGYTVTVSIPKADFGDETTPVPPFDFAIGPNINQGGGTAFYVEDLSTTIDWVYRVTGSFLGGYPGITDDDLLLFTFKATSTTDYSNVDDGCYIVIDYDSVVLKDAQNPYNEIACAGTHDGWVLIDDEDPLVVIDNIGDYPDDPVPYIVQHDGDGLIIPEFDLTYTDDYDLFSAMYLIQLESVTAPDDPADFSLAVGPVDGILTDIDDWPLPIGSLADGTYTIYFLVVDEADHFYILDWDFVIDNTEPIAIVWDSTIPCRTTANANNSLDLKWANDGDVVKNHIWILSYGYPMGDAPENYYPEYEDHSEPSITTPPDPYGASPQNGWVKYTIDAPTSFPYALTGMARGYYYVTIFAADASGNMSDPPADPFYRESISYWPGDVAINGLVQSADIALLTGVWGLTSASPSWNNEIDVGPSTDYARRSRPCPDNVIDIEDLMMFAMNYNNTVYTFYPRNVPEPNPITIALHLNTIGGQYELTLELGENAGFVKGLNIPVSYGDGLALQSLEIGDIWPDGSLLLHTDLEGKVTVSISTLGAEPLVLGNGTIATLTFNVVGANTGLGFEHMTARTWDNQEIEIVNNPGASTDNDDLVNVIPDASYLGKNYPNPFTGSTTIAYGLKEAGSVKLSVFNSRGQLIRTLVNDAKAPGTYQINWNGLDNNNRPVSSGVYFFRMETQGVVKTAKGLLIK